MKSILERIQAMERELPSLVTVIYPDGAQTAVEALTAFEIAVHNREVTILCPRQSSNGDPPASRGGCRHR